MSHIPPSPSPPFLGRQAEVDQILHWIQTRRRPGVLIHGGAGIGKSRLVQHLARQLHQHRAVTLSADWQPADLHTALAQAYPQSPIWAGPVDEDPQTLSQHLARFLTQEAHGQTPTAAPVLLILEDFEHALTPPQPGQPATLTPHTAPHVTAVLSAFAQDPGPSFLLIASRHPLDPSQTPIPAQIQLQPMSPQDRTAQFQTTAAALTPNPPEPHPEHVEQIQDMGQGNPGLQERLHHLHHQTTPDQWDQVIAAMTDHAQDDPQPDDLEDLPLKRLIPHILDWLTPAESQILTHLKRLPVPLPRDLLITVLHALNLDQPDGARLDRLTHLGLLELLPAWHHPPNLILAHLIQPLIPTPAAMHLRRAARLLWDAVQHHPLHNSTLGPDTAVFLTQLALWTRRQLPPAPIPAQALMTLNHWGEWGLQGRMAHLMVRVLGDALKDQDLETLWLLARALSESGRFATAEHCFHQARQTIAAQSRTDEDAAICLKEWARHLKDRGAMDPALTAANQALALFQSHGPHAARDVAVTIGLIADIHHEQGRLQEALALRQTEELPVYQRLNDRWALAVTWCKIAEIHHIQGRVQEALHLLRDEALPIFVALDDPRQCALTHLQIADILLDQGDATEALRLYQEEALPVFERLNDIRELAVTWGKIADLLEAQGDLKEALRIRVEEELPVFERIDDPREAALTRGKIADIHHREDRPEEALRIHLEEELPVYQRLGDRRLIAQTWDQIADLYDDLDRLVESIETRRDQVLPMYRELGDTRGEAWCLVALAFAYEERDRVAYCLDITKALLTAGAIQRDLDPPEWEETQSQFNDFLTNLAEDLGQSRNTLVKRLRAPEEAAWKKSGFKVNKR